eukprot:scaffold284086_cov19-Tisochrysis_lutea.AAC.1
MGASPRSNLPMQGHHTCVVKQGLQGSNPCLVRLHFDTDAGTPSCPPKIGTSVGRIYCHLRRAAGWKSVFGSQHTYVWPASCGNHTSLIHCTGSEQGVQAAGEQGIQVLASVHVHMRVTVWAANQKSMYAVYRAYKCLKAYVST